MGVTIRPIRELDAPNIRAVALEAWQYTYRHIFDQQFIENFINRNYAPEAILSLFPRLQSGTMYFNLAENEAKIVGFCNIGIDGKVAQLYRIYLLPNYIGQGIGRRLLERGEKFLLEHSLNTYFCFVHKDNEIGIRFYVRSGFRHIPEKDHADEWYMEKKLSFP
jgi:ribosomal protein S18 acetylase RimI-like enzyme